MSAPPTDAELYPHVRDSSTKLWHQRTGTGESDGPYYPTRCGRAVYSHMVDTPEGGPEGQHDRCTDGCYR
jgi:hypothetical protein